MKIEIKITKVTHIGNGTTEQPLTRLVLDQTPENFIVPNTLYILPN